MKNVWVFFVSLCAFLGCVGCLSLNESTLPHSPTRLDHVLMANVALVRRSSVTNEPTPICGGVFISSTEVLTAAHCVQRSEQRQINIGPFVIDHSVVLNESPVGDLFKVLVYADYNRNHLAASNLKEFHVAAYDRTRDLAVLSISELRSQTFDHSFLRVSERAAPVVGENVYAVGHPAGLWFNFTNGIVSRRLTRDGSKLFMWSNADIYFGNSGGPVVNDSCEIMGITSVMMAQQSHLGAAIYASTIRNFLTNYHNGIIYTDIPVSSDEDAE